MGEEPVRYDAGEIKVLMVVKDTDAREAYEESLRKLGVAYDFAGSFSDVLSLSVEKAYSGLIVDILTLIRSSKEEKMIAYDCINLYPCLRVKWNPGPKALSPAPLDQGLSPDTEALRNFIEQRCKPFTPRTLRKYNRKDTFLSALLSTCGDCGIEQSLKTFTVNISRGGAFVHTTMPFRKEETVWLQFSEIAGGGPVKGAACWQIPWGSSRAIPGIGVQFQFSSTEQEEQIRKMAKL
jgi:Tfp pilus assembly protein PilZ